MFCVWHYVHVYRFLIELQCRKEIVFSSFFLVNQINSKYVLCAIACNTKGKPTAITNKSFNSFNTHEESGILHELLANILFQVCFVHDNILTTENDTYSILPCSDEPIYRTRNSPKYDKILIY